MSHEIWVIEFNLYEENYKDNRAWHIDIFDKTILSNFDNMLSGKKMDKWVIVGKANSYEEAKKLQESMIRTRIDSEIPAWKPL